MTSIFRNALIDKEKLREIILKNPEYLQPALSFIDLQLGSEEEGIIDFLGVDASGELVIVDFDTKVNNDLLISALSQMQWLKKNQSLLKRLFFSENIDFSQTPQVFLICPAFSEKSISAAKQLAWLDVKFIQFKYIVAEGQDAIVFEEVFCNKKHDRYLRPVRSKEADIEKILTFKPPLVSPESLPRVEPSVDEGISLTPEEIAEFMDFDKALLEEKTNTPA